MIEKISLNSCCIILHEIGFKLDLTLDHIFLWTRIFDRFDGNIGISVDCWWKQFCALNN